MHLIVQTDLYPCAYILWSYCVGESNRTMAKVILSTRALKDQTRPAAQSVREIRSRAFGPFSRNTRRGVHLCRTLAYSVRRLYMNVLFIRYIIYTQSKFAITTYFPESLHTATYIRLHIFGIHYIHRNPFWTLRGNDRYCTTYYYIRRCIDRI